MPVFYNDGQDDAVEFDGQPSFSGGMVSQARPNLLDEQQSSDMENMDIHRFGLLTTRRGIAQVGDLALSSSKIQGAAWFRTPTIQLLIVAANGALHKWDGEEWTTISGFALPDGDADVEIAQGIDKLYITEASGGMNIFSWDGTTFVNLGSSTNAQPPIARFLLWHTGRLFAVKGDTDEIYCSDILDGATWDKTLQQFRVGAGDGDPITGMLAWDEFNLLVFKQRSIWQVTTDPQEAPVVTGVANWPIHAVNRGTGCIAPRSLAQVGNDIWFLSQDGVRSVRRTLATEQKEVSLPISAPIQDWMERVNWAYAHRACAVFWNNRYIIALPIDSETEPSTIFVYNTESGAWSGRWTGWTPAVFAATAFNEIPRLVFGTFADEGAGSGKVFEWQDQIAENETTAAHYQDDGEDYPSRLTTRALTFKDPRSPKRGNEIEWEFHRSKADITIDAILDGTRPRRIFSGPTYYPANALPAQLPFMLFNPGLKRTAVNLMSEQPFREIQFNVQSPGGKLSIRSAIATAFILAMEHETP
jgi:hypothetical protein